MKMLFAVHVSLLKCWKTKWFCVHFLNTHIQWNLSKVRLQWSRVKLPEMVAKTSGFCWCSVRFLLLMIFSLLISIVYSSDSHTRIKMLSALFKADQGNVGRQVNESGGGSDCSLYGESMPILSLTSVIFWDLIGIVIDPQFPSFSGDLQCFLFRDRHLSQYNLTIVIKWSFRYAMWKVISWLFLLLLLKVDKILNKP